MVRTVPLKTAITPYSTPENFVITGKVVSIEVAPPEAIGASFPKYFAKSGVSNKVVTSRIIFERSAITPRTLPAIFVMKMLDKL